MAIKREKMDEIVPKIQFGIMTGYVVVYLLGSIHQLRKTVQKFGGKKKKSA